MSALSWKQYFVYQADYQYWANEVLFTALDRLDLAALEEPQGLFFNTIHHTVDHTLAIQRLWTSRLRRENRQFDLTQPLYPQWRELKNAFRHEIRAFEHWLEAQPDRFFESEISYRADDGIERSHWVRDLLTHMNSHMIHQRGQVSAIASQLGAPTPEMDFMHYKRSVDAALHAA